MNNLYKYLLSVITGIIMGTVSVLWFQAIAEQAEKIEERAEASIKWRQNHFILSEQNLYNELIAQGVDFPEIVQAQAILETGYFKSYACLNKNNLFGLRNNDATYMSFPHWTDCVAAYKKYIQKYDLIPSDYYNYLDKLGYAEDKEYVIKLKQIVNKK